MSTPEEMANAARDRVQRWFDQALETIIVKYRGRDQQLDYAHSELAVARQMMWDIKTDYKLSDPKLTIYTVEWLPGSVFMNVAEAAYNLLWTLGGVWIFKFNGATVTFKRDKDI